MRSHATITSVFSLPLFIYCFFVCLYVSPATSPAQETVPQVFVAEPVIVERKDTTNLQPSEILGGSFWASDLESETRITFKFSVTQVCFWGGNTNIRLTLNGNEFYNKNFSGGYLSVVNGNGYTDPGPGVTLHFTIYVRCTGPWGCDDRWNRSDDGSTKPLQPPTNLSVTNPDTSDRDIELSWTKGSQISPVYYDIYEDTVRIDATSETHYTVSTIPGNDRTWSVATRTNEYGGHTSALVGKRMATAPFKVPEHFTASMDTTVGYVRLSWDCPSEYATHVQLFRNNVLHATVPISQQYVLDSSAVPGTMYEYRAWAYNALSQKHSDYSEFAYGRAAFLSASDGYDEYPNQVYIRWTRFPDGFENELRLYRDGIPVEGVVTNQTEKIDREVLPGKLHEYRLEVVKNTAVRLTLVDYGYAPANGLYAGSVTTQIGSGAVKNVEMRAYATSEKLNKSLLFDGIDDYISAPALNFSSNTVTVSAWIRRDGAQADWTGIVSAGSAQSAAGVYIMSDGELRYNWNNDPATLNWPSGLIVPESVWSFVALVIEPAKATLYLNGGSMANPVPHNARRFEGRTEIGRDAASASKYFRGAIDEVCWWNVSRTEPQVVADQHHILRGNEKDAAGQFLISGYWRLNEGAGTTAGDYSRGGNHHGTLYGGPVWSDDAPVVWHYDNTLGNGQFTIPRIDWREGVYFTVRPYKQGHGFKGASFSGDSLSLPFTSNNHAYSGVNFYDTTAIGISGRVRLMTDPPCPLEGAKILLDGASAEESTDSAGLFAISVSEAGRYTISVEYLNHKFVPPQLLLDIQDPVTNLEFLDTSRTRVSGRVAGGCDNFLGVAQLTLRNLGSGCIDTLLMTDAGGVFEATLPAQKYLVRLVGIASPDSLTIINYFGPDTLDISEHDTTFNFIYHSPPITRISDLPAKGCGVFDVPILTQEETYAMRVEVIEKYGELECAVDTGRVTVFDYIAYRSLDSVIALDHKPVYYPLTPGYPNIGGGGVHPYQKMLVVRTDFDKYTTFDTLWALVRGQQPREFQYATVSPEIPLLILRDPPGDKSYSYLSSTTTASVSIGFSIESEVGAGVFFRWKAGFGGNFNGIGPVGAWAGTDVQARAGVRSTMAGSQEVRLSTTSMLKTSDLDVITGAAGDVYMGAAFNILYAKTDVLDYDSAACTIVRDTGIVWNGNGFKTTYLYTESHIKESVIPDLHAMAAILNASGEKIKQDSAKLLLNQVGVWEQILDYNAHLKEAAVPIPGFPTNVSFSAGVNRQLEAEISSVSKLSIGMNLFIDFETATSSGAKVGDFNEAMGGYTIFAKLDVGISAGVSYAVTNTIGFELADDDAAPPGDAFTLDVLGDPVYCTPVFKLLSGKSSCPWEHPTLPREGVGMTMNTFVLNDVPPDMPGQFDLYLYNLSQSDETRTYKLSAVQGSNPDGAILSVGGAVLGDDQLEFTMEPNRDNPQRATLRVEREAGSVYDYEALQLHLFSPCDPQFDTIVSFSIHYVKPCSDVRIAQPPANWILNSSDAGKMVVVLKDYDTSNHNMTELKFEYRKRGTTPWTPLFSYPRALLPADSIVYTWDMTGLAEGAYEVAASTHCPMGSYYSRIAGGMYDCTAPAAFGSPQPADGSLDQGDDIKIRFSEAIDCASATGEHVVLRNVTKGAGVNVALVCSGDELVIRPASMLELTEGDTMRVTISSISDPYGNALTSSIMWQFVVGSITGVYAGTSPEIPKEFVLEQNYPNPFNPTMTIRFGVPRAVDVSIIVYDIAGREIARPVTRRFAPGYYEVPFDGSGLSSGMYLYRIMAGEYQAVKKMLLIK